MKLVEEYDSKRQQTGDSSRVDSFIKPAKLVRFESPNVEVSAFARKMFDASPSEAKRAREDSPWTEVGTKPLLKAYGCTLPVLINHYSHVAYMYMYMYM